MANIDSDLIRGNIDTIILKTMLEEDKYGLDIIKEVENKSNGTYELKQPTLYSCLKRLENQELISSYWVDSDIGGRRHYYKLTDKGREFYNKKQEEWSKSKFIIDNLLSNFNDEEYRLVKKEDYDKIIEKKEENLNSENDFEPENNETIELEPKSTEEIDDEVDLTTNQDVPEETSSSDNEEPIFEETNNSLENDEFEENNEDAEPQQNETFEDFEEADDVDDEIEIQSEDQSNEDSVGMEINYYNSSEQKDDESQEQSFDGYYSENEENIENDYSASEENFLSSLRAADEEEINEYYGDKNSYARQFASDFNAASQGEETTVQDQFDFGDNQGSVDKKVEEFNSNISKLNEFNFGSSQTYEEKPTEEENDFDFDENNVQVENELETMQQDDDMMSELNSLGEDNITSFANSNDFENYEFDSNKKLVTQSTPKEFDLGYIQNDSTDEEFNPATEEQVTYADSPIENNFDENKILNSQEQDYSYNSSNFDDIISKNLNYESSDNPKVVAYNNDYYNGEVNYKQKLSNLSQYSQMSINSKNQAQVEPQKIEKIDLSEFKSNLAEEGIVVKEFEKINSNDNSERNYLLVNKINLIKSLIIFFGYVFILSSVYIILNNMSFKETLGFSFKYFAYGFIPFGAFLLYRLIVYVIDPYKKGPAKVPTRILLFISFIITVQLLLITYCVNLQLGFYSFAQMNYNHLLWLIPTIISFAPLISTSVYMILFYSQNFNV